MASVVGHGLIGMLCGSVAKVDDRRKHYELMALCVLLAVLPDLDVIVFVLFKPAGMIPHRGFSHSLLFAILAASFVFLLTRKRYQLSPAMLFAVYASAALSQVLMDFLMGAGPKLPLLAPFSHAGFLSPITLVPFAFYSTSWQGLFSTLTYPPTLVGVALEVLTYLPLIVLFSSVTAPKLTKQRKLFYIFVAVLAQVITVSVYNTALLHVLM